MSGFLLTPDGEIKTDAGDIFVGQVGIIVHTSEWKRDELKKFHSQIDREIDG